MAEGVDELEEAWGRVLAAWEDADAHKRFLALADLQGRLAFAGQRYRAVRETQPERREEAAARIEQLLARAMVRMQTLREPPRTGRSRVEWVAFGVSAMLMAAALYQALRAR